MERSDLANAQTENAQLRKLSRAGSSTPKGFASRQSNSERIREQAAQHSIAERSVQEILAILHKWGIHTLGQVAALDREQLGMRLGPQAVWLWERANGRSNRLLKFIQPPESFDESFEFENEIETAEPLLFLLRRFLERLSLRLSVIYLVAKELSLRITFSNKQRYERSFKIPQPTNDADLLFRMLQTHLENFKSEHPIVAVALQAEPIKPASQQFGLFETALPNPNQLYETLARLTALLGADRVGTPVLEETHRPDAFHLEPFSWNLDADLNGGRSAATPGLHSQARRSGPLHTLGAALRRFRPNPTASVLLENDKPVHIRSGEISGKVVDERGPYSLSGNWWHEKVWARAEWDLQLEDGILCRCHESEGTWEADGVYD